MIVEQVYVFWWSVLVGMILTFIFDVFRAFRRSFKMRNIWVYIQDFLFWIIAAIIIVISAFITNSGDIRGYMFVGYGIGCGLYLLTLSKIVLMILTNTLEFIKKCFMKPVEIFNAIIKKIRMKKQKSQEIAGKY